MAYDKDSLHQFLQTVADVYGGQNNSTYRVYKSFFINTLESYCLSENKDFVSFTTDDIVRVVTSKRIALNSARKYISFMRAYAEWLLKENKMDIISFEGHPVFDPSITAKVEKSIQLSQVQKSRYFTSFQQFDSYLWQVFSPDTTQTPEISRYYTDIAILYLAWMGFTTDEMLTLKTKDVYDAGISYRIYPDESMARFFNIYVKTKSYTRYYGNNGKKECFFITDGDKLLKGIEKPLDKYSLARAGRKATALSKKLLPTHFRYNTVLKMEDVRQSAIFCRIYQYETANPSLSATKIMQYFAVDIGVPADKIPSSTTANFLFREYSQWKLLL